MSCSCTLLLLAVVLGALQCSCASVSERSTSAGFNAPCERNTDCAGRLLCLAGRCTAPETGGSEAGSTGDADDADGQDGSAAD